MPIELPHPSEITVPKLYCPDPVRDDVSLGEEVDAGLLDWAEQINAYPGQRARLRDCGFGRLVMLAHPDCDDPARLLAAARCAAAEWSVDDFYLDGDAAVSEPEQLGPRLAFAYAAMAPARVPCSPYLAEYERRVPEDPVLRTIRSCFEHLAEYGSPLQVFRLRHELCVMFVAYNQEAQWRISGRIPPVWEFLLHRFENAFCPCMVVTDTIGGYEVPASEYFDPRVRRAFTTAGVASVLVNDLYSMGKEERTNGQDGFDFSLPRVLAAEEGCTLQQAVDRTAEIHDDLMRSLEAEFHALGRAGSTQLQRFLTGVWSWMAGGKQWHATSGRYHPSPDQKATS